MNQPRQRENRTDTVRNYPAFLVGSRRRHERRNKQDGLQTRRLYHWVIPTTGLLSCSCASRFGYPVSDSA